MWGRVGRGGEHHRIGGDLPRISSAGHAEQWHGSCVLARARGIRRAGTQAQRDAMHIKCPAGIWYA